MPFSTSNNHPNPQLTSNNCTQALSEFLQNTSLLSVATEASSHPSGLTSLYAQPYFYGGGGLGNIKECPLETCLAGGTSRDSITFAAVCIPQECSALDLAARDFTASLERVSQGIVRNESSIESSLANEYLVLHERIAQVNKFLKTGWTCGNLQVPWSVGWSSLYGLVVAVVVVCALVGTCLYPKRQYKRQRKQERQTELVESAPQDHHYQEEKKEPTITEESQLLTQNAPSSSSSSLHDFWNAWNVHDHLDSLCRQRPTTAALDGLRVFSILWIIFGHVLAIESSSGGGYTNPGDFLPPNGFTTKWKGQLLFASRFAVDTFLLISGYLVVHVLVRVSCNTQVTSVCKTYFKTLPALLLHRLLRILPLYCMTLGFYVLIAPHMGSGPFWYQWAGLLEPCQKYGWTNLLFINNFVPFDLPNTATCFYHSWYLALDMQLFLVAPIFCYSFIRNATRGKQLTLSILIISIFTTIYLGWIRKWSINTFDGTAVARYDVEAYAKPHVRAQAYLLGMLLAMKHANTLTNKKRKTTTTWKHFAYMVFAISILVLVTFVTVSGAYARRPCLYKEWPYKDDCGSIWSLEATFWYTALSRIAWSCAVCILVDLCLHQHGGLVGDLLSLKCWTPLAHLSFGAYLVHPIVIFIWQLGNTQKETFRFLEVGMNYIAVCVVSFGAALVLTLFVEFPCAALVKTFVKRRQTESRHVENDSQYLLPKTVNPHDSQQHLYGALPRSYKETQSS